MWIKQLPNKYYEHASSCYGNVMLWQNNNVYIMDNHMSAAWCWLQSCNPKKKYNFMHIDRHYDMLENFYDEDILPLRDNSHIPYEDFINLKRSKGDKEFNVFSWDNYIMAIYTIYPEWFHTNIFLTHKVGDIGNSWGHKPFNIHEVNPLYMDSLIVEYVRKHDKYLPVFKNEDYKLPWIVNLDIDVFFTETPQHIQLFSDDYIRLIAKSLNYSLRNNIQVLTIALSPDCIAGEQYKEKWDNAFRILKIMSEEIKCLKDFPFPNRNY